MTGLSLIYLARFAEREQVHAYDDTLKTRYDGFGCPIDTPTVEGFDPSDFRQTLMRQSERARNLALAVAQAQRPVPADDLRRQCNQLITLRKKNSR